MGQGFESLRRGQLTAAQESNCPDGEIGRHKRLKISRFNERAGSIPAPGTIYMLEPRRPPNPFDPFDDLWRWYAELWPAQRVAFWLAIALVVLAAALWVTI